MKTTVDLVRYLHTLNESILDSSFLETVFYDVTKGEMVVKFKSGAMYKYFDVPETVYVEIMMADSPGKYLNQVVKQYKVEKLK